MTANAWEEFTTICNDLLKSMFVLLELVISKRPNNKSALSYIYRDHIKVLEGGFLKWRKH